MGNGRAATNCLVKARQVFPLILLSHFHISFKQEPNKKTHLHHMTHQFMKLVGKTSLKFYILFKCMIIHYFFVFSRGTSFYITYALL